MPSNNVTTGLGSSALIKLENAVLTAQAVDPIPHYSVVRFTDFNKVTIANNLMADEGIYGVVETDAAEGDLVNVIVEGVLQTPDWDLFNNANVNDPVYVNASGQMTLMPQPTKVIGMVVGKHTILLTSLVVSTAGTIEANITINGPTSGVVITGATGPISSSFGVQLTDDLAAVESMTTTGTVFRTAANTWIAKSVSLLTDVDGILPPSNGGTGAADLSGYLYGNGANPVTATATIPGADISGDISGKANNITGVLDITHGGTGAKSVDEALSFLLPAQSGNGGKVLTTNGNTVAWSAPTVEFNNVTFKPTTLAGYGIVDATPASHLDDVAMHLTPAQNLWLDNITVSAANVNNLTGVTSNIQQQLDSKESAANKGVANGYAGLNSNGVVPFSQSQGPVSSTQLISVGSYYEYDTWADFGTNYDANTLMISAKTLVEDVGSPLVGMYITETSTTVTAVKDGRYIRVYNNSADNITVNLSVRK